MQVDRSYNGLKFRAKFKLSLHTICTNEINYGNNQIWVLQKHKRDGPFKFLFMTERLKF